MNLRDQLKEVLPTILPENPADSIKGTQLIQLVKHLLKSEYSDATLRYHFSIMCCDPSSPIAKVDSGQGYYLRSPLSTLDGARNLIRMSQGLLMDQSPEDVDLAIARANKFQVISARYWSENHRFPYLFDGGKDQHISGETVWRFPDGALVDWDLGEADDTGFYLDKTTLALKQQLGAQPFTLTSVTMKLEADHKSFRQDFFQCLSNSAWAHRGELVYASAIPDSQLVDELRELGNRFGVAITSFGIPMEQLDDWPDATGIERMGHKEFDHLQGAIAMHKITTGQPNPGLNWRVIDKLKQDNRDFSELFSWITSSLETGRAFPYELHRAPSNHGVHGTSRNVVSF